MNRTAFFALLTACAGIEGDPDYVPPCTHCQPTPSEARDTGNLVFFASAAVVEGETWIEMRLADRLEDGRAVQLSGDDHFIAVVNGVRHDPVELVDNVNSYLKPKYLVIAATGDPGTIDIQLERAGGAFVTSTVRVPAAYEITTRPNDELKRGDRVSFAIAPPPQMERPGFANWQCASNTWIDPYTIAKTFFVEPDGIVEFFLAADYDKRDNLGSDDCDGFIVIMLKAEGAFDPAFAASSTPPVGLQTRIIDGVHLWP